MSPEVIWQGINSPKSLDRVKLDQARALADAARAYRWTDVLDLLQVRPEGLNTARIGGVSGFTPLHQAAHGGAPVEVVQALIDLGAFRTLRTSDGYRAVDLAHTYGHTRLLDLLTPQPLVSYSSDKLSRLEQGVHQVIHDREGVQALLETHAMKLPPVDVLTEIPGQSLWFPVPGMYGGFLLKLGGVADEPVCLVESWVRVVEGSEERRLVTTAGTLKLQEKEESTFPWTITPPPSPL